MHDLMKRARKVTVASGILVLMISTPALAHENQTVDAAIGGGLGGAAGAVLGNEVAGDEGAIIGGAIGAAVGTAVTTEDARYRDTGYDHYRAREYDDEHEWEGEEDDD